jgi:hypothetical protein
VVGLRQLLLINNPPCVPVGIEINENFHLASIRCLIRPIPGKLSLLKADQGKLS